MAEKPENQSDPTEDRDHAPHSVDDWETLFEDPQNGLIALIEQAHSLEALAHGAGSTLRQLLIHEDERDRLEDYERRLAAIAATDAEAGDIEQARSDIIVLLRQLKEDCEQAAAARDETAGTEEQEAPADKTKSGGRARRKPTGRRSSTSGLLKLLGLDGVHFSQVNRIGIIALSVLLLLAATVLAVYLHGPEMPEREREAAAALLTAHGESARPDESWEIEKSGLGSGDKFELVFQLTNERHILLIRSLSAMERAKIAVDLCPGHGGLLDKVAAYEMQIRIEIKQGDNTLTAASCPL